MKYESDIILIEQVIAGNQNAYSLLVDKYKRQAFTVAMKILRNREDAEESASDAFLKAYSKLKLFDKNASFSTWLYRIVYNNSISYLRRKKDTLDLLNNVKLDNLEYGEFQISDDSSSLLEDDSIEQLEALKLAISELKEIESLIVTLFYLEEKSVDEIAQITGKTTANVKVILFRARKSLQQKLRLKEKI